MPIVGISCNFKDLDGHPSHFVGHKYIAAVMDGADATPILLPALGAAADVDAVLDRLDGVVLTGGVSNVEPHHYGGPPSREGTPHDPRRDELVLRLIRSAVRREIPLLGICRGLQEMNVAFGGSLHQHLQEVPGRSDHRRPREGSIDDHYVPRHAIRLSPGGLLAGLLGREEAVVNSLHGQGIDRLADGLVVEATAADGTIEAVRVAGAAAFALGVQWHAEWKVSEHPLHAAIFRAFGEAAATRAARRESEANARVQRPERVA